MLRKIPGADAFCVALVLLPICIVPVVEYQRLRVKAYPAPKQVEAVKMVNDRLEQASLRFTEGLPWSCDQIRLFASTHTREEMLRLARRLTAEQRAEAMKCLRKDKNA